MVSWQARSEGRGNAVAKRRVLAGYQRQTQVSTLDLNQTSYRVIQSRLLQFRRSRVLLEGGFLVHLFGEMVAIVEIQPIEALQATGATRLQILFYGIVPQVLPDFTSYTLYRWEVNIREAVILGYVGAGGLGQQIQIAISLFLEHRLLTLILALYLIVTVVDYLSAYLRGRAISRGFSFLFFLFFFFPR